MNNKPFTIVGIKGWDSFPEHEKNMYKSVISKLFMPAPTSVEISKMLSSLEEDNNEDEDC